MGYNTQFEGSFKLNKPLDDETYEALEQLRDDRHDEPNAPSIWCQWVASTDGQSIQWDENEKFYGYIGWIRYINNKFLRPKGYVLDGVVDFQGEDIHDCGQIIATKGKLSVRWHNVRDIQIESKRGAPTKCCIPVRQGVHWINERNTVYMDVMDWSWMDGETQMAEMDKLFGIAIGNPMAVAIAVDVSAPENFLQQLDDQSPVDSKHRVFRMSIDRALEFVDEERGESERLLAMAKYAKGQHDVDWHLNPKNEPTNGKKRAKRGNKK